MAAWLRALPLRAKAKRDGGLAVLQRNFILAALLITLLTGGVTAGLGSLARRAPGFYDRVALPEGPERVAKSQEFTTELVELIANIASEKEWYAHFNQDSVNAYLQEGKLRTGLQGDLLPEIADDPRVEILPDRIRVGVRYGKGPWSTIVSMESRFWLADDEPNTVVVQFLGMRVGTLPIHAQHLLEQVADSLRQSGVEVSWFRYQGFPTAVLRFGADQARADYQIVDLGIENGKIHVRGKSADPEPAPLLEGGAEPRK